MRLKDDHMRNSQLKPAYNLQVAVESEYIVGIDISSDRSDVGTLKPFLKRLRANYGRTFQNLVCDAGYESEENYTYLEQEQITPTSSHPTMSIQRRKSSNATWPSV